jgi:hypothetical protein
MLSKAEIRKPGHGGTIDFSMAIARDGPVGFIFREN